MTIKREKNNDQEKPVKATFRVSVFYRAYLERGQEFKPGLGAGLFASQDYTYNLPKHTYESPLFQASLADREREVLDDLFLVKVEPVGDDDKTPAEETPGTATAKLFKRYQQICDSALQSGAMDRREGDPDDTGLQHLANLCALAQTHIDTYPIDKLSRWLGFVQAILTMRGLVTVQQERDFSRPLFHAAYRTIGYPIPDTVSIDEVGQAKVA